MVDNVEPPIFVSGSEVDRLLDWHSVIDALEAGHRLPSGPVASSFADHGENSIMNLSAWVGGLGAAVKSCSLFPGNVPPVETVQGVVILYDGEDGHPKAMIDGASLTRWKTVGDSLLGARYLAPTKPRTLLIVGSGVIGVTAVSAYLTVFTTIDRVLVWNRNMERAASVVEQQRSRYPLAEFEPVDDLAQAVREADIISCATRAKAPLVLGEWLRPGQHLDLIGAYLPDMREADDTTMQRAALYIDNHANAVAENGEFRIPISTGAITEASIKADLYALADGLLPDRGAEGITLFKNGGGAHLDLMVADLIFRRFTAEKRNQAD